MNINKDTIGAIVLAAGQSRRMGVNKLLMPWQGTTIIQHILEQLHAAHIHPIVMVIGKKNNRINSIITENGIFSIANPNFTDGSMLHSVQIGIREILKSSVHGMLIVLGDQPSIEISKIQQLVQKFKFSDKKMVVPEYGGHKGHPWIISTDAAREVLKLDEPETLRTFLKTHQSDIEYMTVSDSSVLSDIDTLGDYKKQITNHRV